MNKKSVSIIIPCLNEEKYIENCLKSIVNSDFPKEMLEVFVIDGKSSDKTISIVRRFQKKYDYIFLIENINKTVPYGLNMGIEKSSGDYIIRMDVHSEYPKNYIFELIKWSNKLNADNVGSIIITDVKNKKPKPNAIKKVLSNKLGVGNSYFRIGINQVSEVDTVPFGCYKREVFDEVGLFNNLLTRNQDIELNKRIKNKNGKIYLLSHLAPTYYARESFKALAKNNFLTGYWNVLTIYVTKHLSSLSLRHFVPLIFILSLILPVLFMICVPMLGVISLCSVTTYLITITVESIKLNDKSTALVYIFLAFLTLHFSYGFGSLAGLLRLDYLFEK